MKATHMGHCQICGSLQKLPNNKLSLHGYTTKHGFFSGQCMGSRRLPIEVSPDAIQESIDYVERAIVRNDATSLEVSNDTQHYFKDRESGLWRTGEYVKEDGQTFFKDKNFKYRIKFFVSSVERLAADQKDHYLCELRIRRVDMFDFIESQKLKVENWVARETILIRAEGAK